MAISEGGSSNSGTITGYLTSLQRQSAPEVNVPNKVEEKIQKENLLEKVRKVFQPSKERLG